MQFARSVYNFMNSGIAELNYLTRFNINKMIVLPALICSFELGNVLSELMFDDQIAIEQQLNGIIKRRPAYPVILVLHKNIERLNIEMS